MAIVDKEAPILVAAFSDERQLWEAVRVIGERKIGRDFIGVLDSEDGIARDGRRGLHLLSVLAPRRLHEAISTALAECGATATGGPTAMAAAYGAVPHPGMMQSHEMKLPMGMEYPETRRGRGRGRDS